MIFFPRLYRETPRSPDNARLLNELGAYLSTAHIPPKRTSYSWQRDDGTDLTPARRRDTPCSY